MFDHYGNYALQCLVARCTSTEKVNIMRSAAARNRFALSKYNYGKIILNILNANVGSS